MAKKIPGIRNYHSFMPQAEAQLRISRISGGPAITVNQQALKMSQYQPGQYMTVVYDRKWYLGNITQVSNKEEDRG